MRQAIVHGRDLSAERLERFLPSNYSIVGQVDERGTLAGITCYLIEGVDNAGWTLDGYVLPRLASGSIFGKEIA